MFSLNLSTFIVRLKRKTKITIGKSIGKYPYHVSILNEKPPFSQCLNEFSHLKTVERML